ncbi:TOMM precursor leader peptide-binding protein [Spartinivicinus poritis]|uniref:TOMM leader peptide-binding protein n=1 Tax=Spartinivicinus poritis TaxID=2994640 RepID=A0ABT5U398_9GAMM|nr:TOMM precursor leader peptide-binding protein [Spartinivicinus sp. A2-2]MDE1460833.1 TOMM precursor leader peptide-binding protein [Spartinivicinus sp. A2-2]
MPNLYKINTSYLYAKLTSNKLIALSESDSFLLEREIFCDILTEFANVSFNIEEIVSRLSNIHPPALILRAFNKLVSSSLVISLNREHNIPIHTDITFLVNHTPTSLKDKVKLIELEKNCTIHPLLIQHGFKLSNNTDFSIVVVNDYLDPKLVQINQTQLKNQSPWLLFKPFGNQVRIGPLFVPGNNTLCWQCLAYRLKMHQPFAYLVDNASKVIKRAKPLATEESLTIAVRQLKKVLAEIDLKDGSHLSSILCLNLVEGKLESHNAYKRPQCPECGMPYKIDYSNLQINNESTISDCSGGYRSTSPELTYNKYQYLIDPITGIIPALRNYSNANTAPLFNYSSGRNLALQSKNLFWLNNHLRSCSGGKGKSAQQAKAGALCEAIERYSMMYHGQQPCKVASLVELGNSAIHPNSCMNFSEQQFANRESINQQSSSFYSLVPIKFDSHQQLDWASVYSLINKEIKYLPSAYCYAQYPHEDESALIAYPDSNGCAAGNTYAEAILQGSLELIERDAAAIWWYNKILRPEVDLHNIGNDYIATLLDFYRSKERSLFVLDITTDLGIPAFVAVSYNLSNNKEIIYGFGCHLNTLIAVERSIIELNQLLPILLDQKLDQLDHQLKDWLTLQSIDDHPYLLPSNSNKINPLNHYPDDHPTTISSAVNKITDHFAKAEIDLFMLDLTQPDIGMPVVKTIAPGLRHFWRRTGPGRLYTVPVKMGWLDSAYNEDELNPYSIVI